jgi:16S rRNA (guanine527-N7)-methyltransferase
MRREPVASLEVGSPAWKGMIRDGAGQLGVQVTERQLALFGRHAALLLHWNRKTNLTAITAPGEVAVRHVVDSLAALPHLPERGALLDIGSGGGFPGLVLKIARPALSVTLIDAARKKVSFLSHVIRSLGLSDIAARHIRAEGLQDGSFDVVICRALCALPEFIDMALPLLAPKGRLIAMKGRIEETEAEIAHCTAGRYPPEGPQDPAPGGRPFSISMRAYPLPFEETERTLVTIDR